MKLLIAPIEVLTDTRLGDQERRILLALFSFRDKTTDTVWPSLEALAERAGFRDPTQVSKVTRSLADKGWLEKRKRGFSGGNAYSLKVPEGVDEEIENSVRSGGGSPEISVPKNTVEHFRKGASKHAGKGVESRAETAPDLWADSPNLEESSKLERSSNPNLEESSKCNEHTIEHKNTSAGADVSVAQAAPSQPSGIPPCPHGEIIALWNMSFPEHVQVLPERWAGMRAQNLRTRWRENPKHQRLAFWEFLFRSLSKSKFHCGENDRNWRAELGWVLERRNFDRLLELFVTQQRRSAA